ncbi:hypothetical protein HPB47_008433 [Ixodes persulcatus]|uniref:Uncharacterized protein n=1 Tax=Ixodes persulcatus TaxID=34615 RepID=A0AC60P4N6_IXOPE|nr:hypothetical protein HPB47_008433 [Ixodes persulcatus]
MICKVYKNALGLLARTNTEAMEALGMHNKFEEIVLAEQTAQMARLAKTKTGSSVLEKLNLGARPLIMDANVPAETMLKLDVRPIPRHMHPEHHGGRRQARAKALTKTHAENDGAVHVDAARDGDHFVVVAMRAKEGSTLATASVRIREVRIAEEVAIALAVSSPGVTTVFSDSMVAIRNYITGRASAEAVRVLKGGNPSAVTIKWFPVHEAGNAMVDALDRAMADRADRQASRYDPREYGEIFRNHRLGRRRLTPPQPNLTRREAVTFRRL